MLGQFVEQTLEYQNWGANALTITFFLSLVITSITAWGLLQQVKTTWRDRVAEAVSVSWLSYHSVLHLVIITYGVSISSAALMINGLLALLYFPILFGLAKFKGLTPANKVALALFLAALVAMIVSPHKSIFFLVFAIGGLFSISMQPIEMWQ